tara:strand:+ start:1013 stop:4057 length:3045 start_codon:yes stop_codon:yes gene_type:complete
MNWKDDTLGDAKWADPNIVSEKFKYEAGAFWLGCPETLKVPVGSLDDRHILVVGGTRSGKGTSLIIPNIKLWPGSIFIVDPTGDAATITAKERADNPDLGEVYVLDPDRVSDVNDELRSGYNPLQHLNPMCPTTLRSVSRIAEALLPSDDKTHAGWAQSGARRLVSSLILHMLTSPVYKNRRTLATLRELIFRGDNATRKRQIHAESKRENPRPVPDSFIVLFNQMIGNDIFFEGEIAGNGEHFKRMVTTAEKQWMGIHDAAISATNFINNAGMRNCLADSNLSLDVLKNHDKPVSIYLTSPSINKSENFRWLRLMLNMALEAVQKSKEASNCGYPVLFILDEFAGLKQLESLESGVAEIAKYDVKLCFITQNLGQLKNVYEDNWETFVSGSGTRLYFGIEDQFTREYVSNSIGEKQITLTSQSASQGNTTGDTTSRTEGRSESSQNTEGSNTNTSYKTWPLFLRGFAKFFSGLTGKTQANDSAQTSETKGEQESTSTTTGETKSTTNSTSESESFHQRKLLLPSEVGKNFQRVTDKDDPRYPGLAICELSSYQDPIRIRRVNYFDTAFQEHENHLTDIVEPITEENSESPEEKECTISTKNKWKWSNLSRAIKVRMSIAFIAIIAVFVLSIVIIDRIERRLEKINAYIKNNKELVTNVELENGIYSGMAIDLAPIHSRVEVDYSPIGRGLMVFNDGSIYYGGWVDGKRDTTKDFMGGNGRDRYKPFKASFHRPDMSQYYGEWANGQFNNHGTLQYPDGSMYDGYWRNGKRNGVGTMYYANGEIYAGDWERGKRNGKGVLSKVDKTELIGNWDDDIFKGKSLTSVSFCMTFNNECVRKLPRERHVYDDGTVYFGTIARGFNLPTFSSFYFNGALRNHENILVYEIESYIKYKNGDRFWGTFYRGKPQKGYAWFANGHKYVGQFTKNQFENGIFTFKNGDKYEGIWVDGILDGSGIYTTFDGAVINQIWQAGKKVAGATGNEENQKVLNKLQLGVGFSQWVGKSPNSFKYIPPEK